MLLRRQLLLSQDPNMLLDLFHGDRQFERRRNWLAAWDNLSASGQRAATEERDPETGNGPLHVAVRRGDLQMICRILEAGTERVL